MAALVLGSCTTGAKRVAAVENIQQVPTPTIHYVEEPLTGSLVTAIRMRPALAVKIENELPARPQMGLDRADIVYEEEIEGGDTRFMAIFQSEDAPVLGPVRSARMVDPDILAQFGRPLFAYSGGAVVVLEHVRSSGLFTMTENTHDAMYRIHSRFAPHNLYSSTSALYGAARGQDQSPPPAQFSYADSVPVTPAILPASSVTVAFSGAQVSRFAYQAGSYLRSQGYSSRVEPHLMSDGTQISARNVVVMFIDTKEGHHLDAAGHHTPDGVVVGSGRALLLRDGLVMKGTWSRASIASPSVFTGADGSAFALARGNTWIELAPPTANVSVE